MIINPPAVEVGLGLEVEVEHNAKFMCGVVEGFYGRPWTSDQRKKLFQRMNGMGMDTYLYAPKDDSKHRMYWRDLYTVEEADNLTTLITAATEENVTFVYALSPGLDITYSSSKEVACLKRKLEQVTSFGCKAFALLFDDIEVDMSEADKEIFQSFAQAQVSVTNEVYQHLGSPAKFLFCPTEYCASRAVPSVVKSEYLTTIGAKLLTDINVLWTGPKVISKKISIKSVQEISSVLQRPPVIWDNIHANDYDPRRLFLGPYDGRSSELIPYLNGVMTNPNCEFEANYIAMHTLAQWSKSNTSGVKKDFILSESPVTADIELETEGEFKTDEDIPVNTSAYQPRLALCDAIKDWIEVFYHDCPALIHKLVLVPPTMPVGQDPSLAVACTNLNATLQNNINDLNDSYMQPSTLIPVNNLLDDSSSSSSEDEHCIMPEPMDCGASTSGSSTCSGPPTDIANASVLDKVADDVHTSPDILKPVDEEIMQIDAEIPITVHTSSPTVSSDEHLTERDVRDFIDLFFLPFEHGSCGTKLLDEFHWLKITALEVFKKSGVALDDWTSRATDFCTRLDDIFTIFHKFCSIPNRAMLYDLFPYIWDMSAVMNQVYTFTKWLALGQAPPCGSAVLLGSPYSWSNIIFRKHFSAGDREPWIFRGGLQAEFQRMLPLEGSADLLLMACPLIPQLHISKVRPYTCSDKNAVYEICRKTCDDGLDGTEIFPGQPDLIGDKLVGAFVTMSPEYCFVIEDDQGIYGYVLATKDGSEFSQQQTIAWVPAMTEKYPATDKEDNLTPAEEIISGFHGTSTIPPSSLFTSHPAVVRMDVVPDRVSDPNIFKRALASVVATLKVSGAHGIHTEIHIGDQNTVDFYIKLGFIEIVLPYTPEHVMYMGRLI